jgi:hypothetical protein
MRTKLANYGGLAALGLLGVVTLAALAEAARINMAIPPERDVGDIIVFNPWHRAAPDTPIRFAVHRPNQFGCVIDLTTVTQSGGSLVIEAKLASEGRSYRLHWAGDHTSTGSSDCGSSADLIIDPENLEMLANAAGGYGIGRPYRSHTQR